MMYAVLDQLDREGGEVSRQRFLEIGEEHSYNRRGMAGFYQQLVEPTPDQTTRLTSQGRERLRTLGRATRNRRPQAINTACLREPW